jgi:hypothetical protein
MAECVLCLQEIKLFEKVPHEMLDRLGRLQLVHVDKHKAASGTAHVKLKAHYALHFPGQTNEGGIVLDIATCERKGTLIKDQIQRLPRCHADKNINIHITVGVNLCQLNEMQHGPSLCSLVGKATAFRDGNLQGACARACMTSFGLALVAGDVLLVDAVPHVLRACVKLDNGSLSFLVQPCSFVRAQGAGKLWKLLTVLLQEPDESHFYIARFSFLLEGPHMPRRLFNLRKSCYSFLV